jgi:hypothetical protein
VRSAPGGAAWAGVAAGLKARRSLGARPGARLAARREDAVRRSTFGACSCLYGRPSMIIVFMAARERMPGIMSGSTHADVNSAHAGVGG